MHIDITRVLVFNPLAWPRPGGGCSQRVYSPVSPLLSPFACHRRWFLVTPVTNSPAVPLKPRVSITVCATSSLSIIQAARAEPSRVSHTLRLDGQCRPGKTFHLWNRPYIVIAHTHVNLDTPPSHIITMPTSSCLFCLQGTSRVAIGWVHQQH